ncbi:hypothetical protein C1T31_09130 [Hanstruepera neustonica]|uniref:DUF5034 domain-containing protein n=1 Tax=Hanstruepera neustonica TaxID=1445657 RepID=A0A2K1DYM7_9FLAO|nr:hypothetical protein [Hanstruepera neustonica]PNQ73139.1 hypothetical protein C1T31_09130 [Hanstruepera neustonica]
MIKRVVKVFSFFALFQLVIYSCCEQVYNVYYEQTTLTAIDSNDFDASSVTTENLLLNLNFEYKYIQIADMLDLNHMVDNTYATTCAEDYFFRDSVINITITANENVLDIESGNPINDKLFFINPNTLESQSLNELVNYLNNHFDGYYYQTIDLAFNESLPSELSLEFHIKIDLEGGRSLESTTEIITIE